MVECKSATVSVQNLFAPLCWVFGKHCFTAFSLLALLISSSKFHSYLYKTKKTKQKFQLNINISASPKAGRDNCLPIYSVSVAFLQVRKISQSGEIKGNKINISRIVKIIICILLTKMLVFITKFGNN